MSRKPTVEEEAMKAAEEAYEAAFPDAQAIDFNGLHDAFDAYHCVLKRYKHPTYRYLTGNDKIITDDSEAIPPQNRVETEHKCERCGKIWVISCHPVAAAKFIDCGCHTKTR